MIRFLPACLALFSFAPNVCHADDPVPPGHSTVHVIFMISYSHQTMGGGGMGGMMGTAQAPMVRVGDAVVPADGIRPIRITIDGDFVGHALVGPQDIKPVFVLPAGKHRLTFATDGFDPVASDIKVLGTNSKQYLLVSLPSERPESKSSAVSADASNAPPSDE